MSKKMMLLALSVVSAALFALPAVAAATPAHISATENFTVTPGAVTPNAILETTGGEKVECTSGVTGSGSWETTTTGSISLEFHACKASGFTCTTHPAEGGTVEKPGTISTTKLPFHLITLPGPIPGVLLTPTANTSDHFASFTCAGGLVKKKVTGKGIIGTVTSPACDAAAQKTATLKFEEVPGGGVNTGVQKHTSYTGVTYPGLLSNGTPAAQTTEARLDFNNAKSIDCT